MAYRPFGGMNGYATQHAETRFREKRDRIACFYRSANIRNGERAGNLLRGREALPAKPESGSSAHSGTPFIHKRMDVMTSR